MICRLIQKYIIIKQQTYLQRYTYHRHSKCLQNLSCRCTPPPPLLMITWFLHVDMICRICQNNYRAWQQWHLPTCFVINNGVAFIVLKKLLQIKKCIFGWSLIVWCLTSHSIFLRSSVHMETSLFTPWVLMVLGWGNINRATPTMTRLRNSDSSVEQPSQFQSI